MNNLSGNWVNELGSKMILEVNGNSLSGIYISKVGDVLGEYKLTGFVNTTEDESIVLGWIVLWVNDESNSNAVTAWSGQYQIDKETNSPVIVTTWLLTEQTNEADDWKSTMVGKDYFHLD